MFWCLDVVLFFCVECLVTFRAWINVTTLDACYVLFSISVYMMLLSVFSVTLFSFPGV